MDMVYSMTGFGHAEAADENWSVKVEAKAVNHRFLDIHIRLSRNYQQLEETFRQLVTTGIQRGRIELSVNIKELSEQNRIVKIDRGLLAGLYRQWQELQGELPLPDLTFDHIFQIPDLVKIEEPEIDWEPLTKLAVQAGTDALEQLNSMRLAEGEQLAQDLLKKIDSIEEMVQGIRVYAPEVVVNYRNRLQERLNELLTGTSLTPERFEAEVAIFADRSSIDEEIVRLESHIYQFRTILKETGPIGRKLDFLIQEMNREVNTIGSKANDLQITKAVVELKSEIERIREQVQNLE